MFACASFLLSSSSPHKNLYCVYGPRQSTLYSCKWEKSANQHISSPLSEPSFEDSGVRMVPSTKFSLCDVYVYLCHNVTSIRSNISFMLFSFFFLYQVLNLFFPLSLSNKLHTLYYYCSSLVVYVTNFTYSQTRAEWTAAANARLQETSIFSSLTICGYFYYYSYPQGTKCAR
ncbi:hypothetical protein ASPBRDRAFT_420005 [Aspergillus brasiliensis CBS 101740]|uniref:Uncharacterized protein n=1 Tax=Aspergillus brasiliensis (strain CBS 101740 / IMI 381727 / IBT 21946) TaxID=767769 RepID=A0A1L9U4F4_ASPBC|nr:hypothetical protein ASPBRDRAFT_420005 [Aspergillus brasiliensis CBS 101740]